MRLAWIRRHKPLDPPVQLATLLFLLVEAASMFLVSPTGLGLTLDSEQILLQQIEQEIDSGQIDLAIDGAHQSLKRYPDSSPLNQVLATAYYKKGMKSEAAEAFRRAIQLDPSVSMNYFRLALVELSMRDPRATKDLEKFVSLDPNNAQGHLVLGHAYHYSNRTLPAIEQYKRALELSPGLHQAHYHLGLAYESQGDLNGALDEFKKEIEVNPAFDESYGLAGNIELERGNFDAAEKLFRSSLSRNPEAFPAHYGLARVLVATNRLAEGEAELKKCLELTPDSIEAHYLLARTYQRLGRKAEAEREYQTTSSLHAQHHANVTSGIAARQE